MRRIMASTDGREALSMDGFYRGVETSLLGLTLLLGLGALLLPPLPEPSSGEVPFAVTLPMITVTAGR
jgi:hypothetical protein